MIPSFTQLLRYTEFFLIGCLLLAILSFFIATFDVIAVMSWTESDTYFFTIRRILALAIGIELVRFVFTNEIETLLEILIFLIARQLIHMEIESEYTYLLPATIAVSVLIALRIYLQQTTQKATVPMQNT